MQKHILFIFLILSSIGLTQDSENIEKVATLLQHWDSGSDIAIKDQYAYIPSGNTGLQITDISDLEHPMPAGCYTDTLRYMKTIEISGDYAYIGCSSGYAILDISEPLSPELITFGDLEFVLKYTQIEDTNLYLSGHTEQDDNEGYVEIVDVSNPREPESISVWRTEDRIRDIFASDDDVFVVTSSHLKLLQLNDGDSLEVVASIEYQASDGSSKLYIVNDLAYLLGGAILQIIDVSNPDEMEIIGRCEIKGACVTEIFDIIVDRNFVYVGSLISWCGGLSRDGSCAYFSVVVASVPTEPELLCSFELVKSPNALAMLDEDVIIAQVGGLRALDVSEPDSPELIGFYNANGNVRWIHSANGFVYVLDHFLWLFDCSNLDDPRFVRWLDLNTNDVFATENNIYAIIGSDSLMVFNITESPQLNEVTVYPFSEQTSNLFIEEPFIYTEYDDELVVYEMTDLDTLTRVGEFNADGLNINDISVSDGIISVARRNGISIIDATNPAQMNLIGSYELRGATRQISTVDDIAYVINSQRGLIIFDIADPSSLDLLSSLEIDEVDELYVAGDHAFIGTDEQLVMVNVRDVEIPALTGYFNLNLEGNEEILCMYAEDNLIYLAFGGDLGIYRSEMEGAYLSLSSNSLDFGIFPISKNQEKTLVLRNFGIEPLTINNLSTQGANFRSDFNGEIVLEPNAREEVTVTLEMDEDGLSEGRLVIDSTDPRDNTREVSLTGAGIRGYWSETLGFVRNVFVSGNYAYVPGSSELQVIDISDPENPEVIGSCDTPGYARMVEVSDVYAYVVNERRWTGHEHIGGGLSVISVSNPENPEEVGYCDLNESMDYVKYIFLSGGYAYIAGSSFNGMEYECFFVVIDISDPSNPVRRGRFGPIGSDSNHVRVAVSGDICYFIISSNLIYVVDISTPNSPRMINRINTHTENKDIFVSDEIAYVTVGIIGLRIIDVSNPRQSELLVTFNTPESAHDIFVDGSTAYVLDGENSLLVIDVSDPANPALVDSYWTPDARGVHVSGSYAYVANGRDGLVLLGLSDEWGVDLEVGNTIPGDFCLNPAYPNPFNSTTTIEYGLPYPGRVSLWIYNSLGQQITTLFEGYQKTGIHSANLNANGLPSGLYFVRLESSGQILSKEVIVLR